MKPDVSDWLDQFFSSLSPIQLPGIWYSSMWFFSSSTCVLLTPALIICRFPDDSPAYISDHLVLAFALVCIHDSALISLQIPLPPL